MADERRRYFRIDDSVGISYQLLSGEEADNLAMAANAAAGGFDFVSNFDNRIQTLLDSCKVQSPLAAELLDLVNKKLNFVIQQMGIDAELINNVAYTLRKANISACGLAFYSEEGLKAGQKVQLDIMLYPSELRFSCLGLVVGCDKLQDEEVQGDKQYFLRINFESINSTDQEMLIQHIVKQQGSQLRLRQEQSDSE
jgi:c-di-GMP-binding flagellar brake protein YcgR